MQVQKMILSAGIDDMTAMIIGFRAGCAIAAACAIIVAAAAFAFFIFGRRIDGALCDGRSGQGLNVRQGMGDRLGRNSCALSWWQRRGNDLHSDNLATSGQVGNESTLALLLHKRNEEIINPFVFSYRLNKTSNFHVISVILLCGGLV